LPIMPLSANLSPLSFDQLAGWCDNDHLAAYNCFLISAERMREKPYSTKTLGIAADRLAQIGRAALENPATTGQQAKQFFEKNFTPHQFIDSDYNGLLTGYFEPELLASRDKTSKFQYPLYRRPDDLIDIDDDNRPATIEPSFAFARRAGNEIVEYFDRGQIQNGALEGRNLELYWLEDPVDVFFIHIQGSTRLVFDDGSSVRLSYTAKTGHPYTAIGKILVEWGEMKLAEVDMQSIRRWLADNHEKRDQLLACNRSYIFFQQTRQKQPEIGPVAAAGIALTPGRSLAIDRHLHTFGTPLWVETKDNFVAETTPLSRLLIAQDTGTAIIGSERGDFFVGTGEKAGQIAGKIKHAAKMNVLVPNPVGSGQAA